MITRGSFDSDLGIGFIRQAFQWLGTDESFDLACSTDCTTNDVIIL